MTYDTYLGQTEKSARLYQQAKNLMPGGLTRNSIFRPPHPFYVREAKGTRIVDVDGNAYTDYCLNYGPLILGHAHPEIVKAIKEQAEKGLGYGAPTELEIEVAALVRDMVPCAKSVRFGCTGTEAIMFALRAARAFTGRDAIIKFEGAYHGAYDYTEVSVAPNIEQCGSIESPIPVPGSQGITQATVKDVIPVTYNDLECVNRAVKENRDRVAAIIVDPSMNRCGLPQPNNGFLQDLRETASQNGILLVFDEVASGFRYGPGGAQEYFGVTPDIAAFGKVLGGGTPLSAVAGREDIMRVFAPDDTGRAPAPYSGTFFGNPLMLAASLATLRMLKGGGLYAHINTLGEDIRTRVRKSASDIGAKVVCMGACSMLQIHFVDRELKNYRDFTLTDKKARQRLYFHMLAKGIYMPLNGTTFISSEHTAKDAEIFVKSFESFLQQEKTRKT